MVATVRSGFRATDATDAALPPAPSPPALHVRVTAGLAVVAGFGLVGLALAVVGWFMPALVVPLGAVGAVLLFRAAQPQRVASAPRTIDRVCAVGAVAVAAGQMIVNLTRAAQHLLIDR